MNANFYQIDVATLLSNSLSSDNAIRQQATWNLEKLCEENFEKYLELLVKELVNEQNPSQTRISAGVALKNSLVSKDPIKRAHFAKRWISLDENIRAQIKSIILKNCGVLDQTIGTTTSQIVAAIASIELPLKQWPELTQILLHNVTNASSSPQLKRSSLEAIGFICEDLDPSILASKSNEILTATVQGARKEEENPTIRKSALNALSNSLQFICGNFDHLNERNIIMQVVCEATQANDDSVVVAAFECLVGIMTLYYKYMVSYMNQGLFMMTIESMKNKNDNIVLQAIEFWSTVCDEEVDLQIDKEEGITETPIFNFAKAAFPFIITSLLDLLTHHKVEDDEDEWNVSKASATCLSLFANCIQDDVINIKTPLFEFIEKNIGSSDWKYREAAVMAFTSILDGPAPLLVEPYVKQAFPLFLNMLTDSSLAVRDTAAWSIGQIINLVFDAIDKSFTPTIIASLLNGLKDKPRIAAHCAHSLANFTNNCLSFELEATNLLSPYFEAIVSSLLTASQRDDVDESNLNTAVYQCLSSLVINCTAMDTLPLVLYLNETILFKMEQSVEFRARKISGINHDEEMKITDTQSHLCVVLQNIVKKLGNKIEPYTDRLMMLFLKLLESSSSKSASLFEDIFLTIGILINEVQAHFMRYMPLFFPKLLGFIQNHTEYSLCSVAIGIVSDLAHSFQKQLVPYSADLLKVLIDLTLDPSLEHYLEPYIIVAIGDIIISIGPACAPYLERIFVVLFKYCSLVHKQDSNVDVEYLNSLKENILETFSCIIQGARSEDCDKIILGHCPDILLFIAAVYKDEDKIDVIRKKAVGVLDDLEDAFSMELQELLKQQWIISFVQEYRKNI